MYHFGFIIEQTLGHVTHGLNLQKHIVADPLVRAEWGLPMWKRDGVTGKIPLFRSNWTIQAGLRSRKMLADFSRISSLDALFFHTQVTAVLCPDWLRRIPSVVSLDATPRQYDRLGAFYGHSIGPYWLERWKWRLNCKCFRLARHLVTWSAWARDGLVDDYEVPADKISVIPPGVDTQAWARPGPRGFHPGPVRILFVGGDLERKGGRMLLEAFRRLCVQIPALPSGNGELPVELHLVARDSIDPEPGVVLYQGLQPNSQTLKNLFFKADIFCLPTQGDCLPMVLSEAGAAGLPLVSTRVAAIPEIVRDGETGFLVPPGDLEALTTVLKRLIMNPALRLRLGHASEQIVRQRYDAEHNTNHLLDLMKQICAESRAEGFLQ